MNADAIVIEMFYPHPIKQVWTALTDPAALAEWLMPNDFQPRVGHRFTFQAISQDSWNGTVYCEVIELDDAMHRLSFTWHDAGATLNTLVIFTLEAANGGTKLLLEHSGFASSGNLGLTVRDLLASGWNSRILRERLPAFLNEHANDKEYSQ